MLISSAKEFRVRYLTIPRTTPAVQLALEYSMRPPTTIFATCAIFASICVNLHLLSSNQPSDVCQHFHSKPAGLRPRRTSRLRICHQLGWARMDQIRLINSLTKASMETSTAASDRRVVPVNQPEPTNTTTLATPAMDGIACMVSTENHYDDNLCWNCRL